MEDRDQVIQQPQEQTAQQGEEITVRAERIMQTKKVINMIEEKLNASTRIPIRKDMGMVNVGELLNLFSQLLVAMPGAVDEAVAVLAQRQQLEQTSQRKAQELVSNATANAAEMRRQADADSSAMLAEAQERARAIEEQAQMNAQGVITAAQQEAQRLISEHEITRRAEVYAGEMVEKARLNVDSMYKTASTEVNKMLSGAAAALSRSGMELAGVRDQLLGGIRAGDQGGM